MVGDGLSRRPGPPTRPPIHAPGRGESLPCSGMGGGRIIIGISPAIKLRSPLPGESPPGPAAVTGGSPPAPDPEEVSAMLGGSRRPGAFPPRIHTPVSGRRESRRRGGPAHHQDLTRWLPAPSLAGKKTPPGSATTAARNGRARRVGRRREVSGNSRVRPMGLHLVSFPLDTPYIWW